MDQNKTLFIYDRKEVGLLILLGVTVALFAFTLGVHLGKRVGPKEIAATHVEATSAASVADKAPERHEVGEQTKGVPEAVEETLNTSLHDEVAKTGIKLDTPRAIELPTKPKAKAAGATTVKTKTEVKTESHKTAEVHATGKYTLQVGSYPDMDTAKPHADEMEKKGVHPFLRPVDLKSKGKWFRLYVGGYSTIDEAEAAGTRYKAEKVIQSFLVAHTPE